MFSYPKSYPFVLFSQLWEGEWGLWVNVVVVDVSQGREEHKLGASAVEREEKSERARNQGLAQPR